MNTQWLVPSNAERYQCPTTGEWFRPLSVKVQEVAGHQFVWTFCPCCDRMGRRRGHPEFEPLEPQPHCYTVEQERAV